MGSENVYLPKNQKDIQSFVKRILRDTKALEKMLLDDVFDKENMHIGAEQEFNIIDKHYKPLGINLQLLEQLNDDLFTTELARFNLEVNLPPLPFKGKCFSEMENTILRKLAFAREIANNNDADIILSGILPTLRKFDLEMHNLTPIERYRALCQAILNMRGDAAVELKIRGIDELITKHDSPLLEACNTGFQVHLQVTPEEFPLKYNIAQAVAGPALACATYSPMLFGKRLWHETRIALFQQSVDTRTSGYHLRDRSPRVMFGNDWVRKSIVEIYKEDIMRFRVLISSSEKEDSFKKLKQGIIPDLSALQVHNSTVYRWNRPCYGNAGDKPHLRIENRCLPAGPTVIDEMANMALWVGLLNGMGDHYPDLIDRLDFDAAKSNFLTSCRNGITSGFEWIDHKKYNASDLLLNELIPIAKEGLAKANIDEDDSKRYFDVLEDRVKTSQTGSSWMFKSYAKLIKKVTKEEAITAITACSHRNQLTNEPVHTWKDADLSLLEGDELSSLTVEEFMSTDLFTVQENDIIELVAEIVDGRRIRYVPVEDDDGHLVGLVTSRGLLRHYLQQHLRTDKTPIAVKSIMIKNPVVISSKAGIAEAMAIMQKRAIGCLPVVQDQALVGIITEQDFVKITNRLIKHVVNSKKKK